MKSKFRIVQDLYKKSFYIEFRFCKYFYYRPAMILSGYRENKFSDLNTAIGCAEIVVGPKEQVVYESD